LDHEGLLDLISNFFFYRFFIFFILLIGLLEDRINIHDPTILFSKDRLNGLN